MHNPDQILESAAELFRTKNKEYGENWKNVGPALAALFPNGLQLKTAADFDRAHIFFLIMVKMSRYASNWTNGGHKDSVEDLTVYGSMLNHIDQGMPFRGMMSNVGPDGKLKDPFGPPPEVNKMTGKPKAADPLKVDGGVVERKSVFGEAVYSKSMVGRQTHDGY